MDLMTYLSKYMDKINEAIKEIWDRQIGSVSNEFLKHYYSELRDYFLSGGKRIRPILAIATYNAFNKNNDDKIIIPSVGIEFLHNASLIHDDIIDNDDFRRGKPAFHYRYRQFNEQYSLKKMEAKEFGRNIGIIGGDSAFLIGLEAYLTNNFDNTLNFKAIEYYKKAFKEVSDGVLIEVDMVNQRDLTMEDYITMIKLKTGALIEKSILIGAMYAGAPNENNPLLSEFGLNLGIIFQIIDDILGTFGDEKKTGKPTDGDIREGKKTCLLIMALNSLEVSKRDMLLNLIEKPEISNEEVEKVRELFKEGKADAKCLELANEYYNRAKSILNMLEPKINVNEAVFFESLLEFVIKREF